MSLLILFGGGAPPTPTPAPAMPWRLVLLTLPHDDFAAAVEGAEPASAFPAHWYYTLAARQEFAMFKNVASQKVTLFAFDYSTGAPKTGDAGNITAYVAKDDGAVTVLTDTSASELEASNAKGLYSFDLSQAETNADKLVFSATSSTGNVSVVPTTIYTLPTTGILAPTTSGRTLDVTAGGAAGVDWANVESPTTTLALTGTTIAVTQQVDVNTIKTNPVVNAGTITFPTGATLASTTNITAGTITTATNVTTVNGLAAGVITAASIAADAITDAKVASDVTIASVTGAVGSVTGAVGSVTGAVGSVTGSVGSVVATVSADVVSISGDSTAADNAESYFDGVGYGEVLQRTTIATLASQTSFTLTAGSADNDAYNDCIIVVQDASTAAQKAVGVVDDYTGSTKTVTLRTDPAVFTMATTDTVTILADRSLKPTVMNRTLDVSAGGEAGLDWNNVGTQGATVSLSATTLNLVTTTTTATNVTTVNGLAANVITAASMATDASAEIADAVWDEDATGHQTQGTFGQAIGDPAADANTIYAAVVTGAAGATIAADVIAIKAETASILEDTGTTLQAEVDGIQADTEDIQSRLPAALTADGNIKADSLRISGSATAADNVEVVFDTDFATNYSTSTDKWQVQADVQTIKTNAVVNAGTVTFPTNSTLASTTNITAAAGCAVSSLGSNVITAASLAADAVDEIWDEAMAELAGVPGVTASLRDALQFVFLLSRNRIEQTATTQTVYKDDGTTPLGTSTVSDDSTTFVRGEFS